MNADDRDRRVRWAAFDFVGRLVGQFGDVLPFAPLREGFEFEGARVPLLGPQGIFKPAVLPEMPLTIATAPPKPGRPRPYDDEISDDGFLRYRYRGTDPHHRDNVALRLAWQRQVPLIYLQRRRSRPVRRAMARVHPCGRPRHAHVHRCDG